MSKILISGYYGFANAGDEAMLTAIIEALRAQRQNLEITVLSGNPEVTAAKHQVRSLHRFGFCSIVRAMLSMDLLLSGGGSLLQDVTSKRSLFYYLSILLLAKLLGKKVMLYAQGIGPIRSHSAGRLTKWVCGQADLITVRDDGSFEELRKMGLDATKIIVTADAVFALPELNPEAGQQFLEQQGLAAKRPLIGLAVRHWTGEAGFCRVFAEAITKLRQTYQAEIVFVPLQIPQDVQVAQAILALLPDKTGVTILEQAFTTEEYLALSSGFDLLIGMRLHALVFAALTGTPFLAVSYDPKVDRFVQGMEGVIAGQIATITAADIVQAAATLWQQIPTQQNAKIKQLRTEAHQNAGRAIALLET
ncbi:MAG: polysaccharide pyruvyl transferase CsaB [Acidaminococcaceae bacterium]